MMILSIDPGNIESAYILIDKDYKHYEFGKVLNEKLLKIIKEHLLIKATDTLVIEMIASQGMAVGKTVFDTCVWIGRFIQAHNGQVEYIYRAEEKIAICGTMKAKDSNIRQALIDRFGVVGVKANQGFFYGFKADIWSAYAVGVTYLDKIKELRECDEVF